MSFISYAQNFEDVMLWRALKHIEGGTYVDVGAQHPILDSVSKGFYEHHWRGVHIEPVPQYAQLLRDDRPEDVVLGVALGESAGVLELNVFDNTGLSTGVNEIAERHEKNQNITGKKIFVPLLTLNTALSFLGNKPIHWLKIDVEGFEYEVLKGWDSQTLRPWIIVIEATKPMSTQLNYQEWEPLLLSSNYQFAYFDGLNRFYVAQEHIALLSAFSAPPNVFDDVRLSGLSSAEWAKGLIERHETLLLRNEQLVNSLNSTEKCISEIQSHADNTQASLSVVKNRLQEIEAQHDALKQSCLDYADSLNAAETRISEIKCYADDTQANLSTAQSRLQELETQHHALSQDLHHWHVVAQNHEKQIKNLYASRSWRVTKPLRLAMRLTISPRETSNDLIKRVGLWALGNSLIKPVGIKIFKKLPKRFAFKLRRVILEGENTSLPTSEPDFYRTLKEEDALSPQAKIIFAQLRTFILEDK